MRRVTKYFISSSHDVAGEVNEWLKWKYFFRRHRLPRLNKWYFVAYRSSLKQLVDGGKTLTPLMINRNYFIHFRNTALQFCFVTSIKRRRNVKRRYWPYGWNMRTKYQEQRTGVKDVIHREQKPAHLRFIGGASSSQVTWAKPSHSLSIALWQTNKFAVSRGENLKLYQRESIVLSLLPMFGDIGCDLNFARRWCPIWQSKIASAADRLHLAVMACQNIGNQALHIRWPT